MTLVTRSRWNRVYLFLALGVALAVVFIGWDYFTAPPDYAHSQGDSDGEMFLGRWWEPFFAVFLAFVGYIFWVVGVTVGLLLNGLLELVWRKRRVASGLR